MCGRVRIQGKKHTGAMVLSSKAGIMLGTTAAFGCPADFGKGGQRICLSNRTCFRIAGGRRGPFIMGLGGRSVAMLNAAFGIRTCRGRSCDIIALLDNQVVLRTFGRFDRSAKHVFVGPGRYTLTSGRDKSVSLSRIGTSLAGT